MSEQIKDGGPAFPEGERWFTTDHYGAKEEHARGVLRSGMTLRDYFAAKAMAAMFGNKAWGDCASRDDIAEDAYAQADAMLRAREAKS